MGSRFNLYEQILKVSQQEVANIYTSIPARVMKYDPVRQCVDVRPIVHTIFQEFSSPMVSPTIFDVPVIFPSAGGGILSFPIEAAEEGNPEKTGDIVMLEFSMKGFDEWLVADKDGDLAQKNRRMHNMTDAVAKPCLYRFKDNLAPHEKHVELKFKNTVISLQDDDTDNSNLVINTDGQTGITINVTNGNVNVNATSGTVNIDSPNTNMTGNLTVEGDINCNQTVTADTDCIGGGKSLKTHTHTILSGSSSGETAPPS
tara:strand:- start:32708 stop:33481 length:774 start_codon:yes stop_codon:yes gene_type:complete